MQIKCVYCLLLSHFYYRFNSFQKLRIYISHICREAPHGRICMKVCTGGRLADIINCAKFYLNQIWGFDSVGSNFWLSHRNEMSPLTQGLNYRSACELPFRTLVRTSINIVDNSALS